MHASSRPMVLMLRTLRVDNDSRATKTIDAYSSFGFDVEVISWSRGSNAPGPDYITYYYGQGKIGSGWKNLTNFLLWIRFATVSIFKRRSRFVAIHVVDFDTACFGVPIAKLLRKRIIYDAYDHFGSTRSNRLARKLFTILEKMLINLSDVVILPSAVRCEQYDIPQSNVIFISNIPNEIHVDISEVDRSDGRIVISYVGTLQKDHRGLEFLPEICAANKNIVCELAGVGELRDFFERKSQEIENFKFVGRVSYDEALSILGRSNCTFGAYLLSADYHRYAAPNKLFEHLMLGIPLITNTGTPVAEFVERRGTGILFDGTLADLQNVTDQLTHTRCRAIGLRARQLWLNDVRFQRQRELEIFQRELVRAIPEYDGDGAAPKVI
jgi:glycosyltransferase involved in cell wall biosynthesis